MTLQPYEAERTEIVLKAKIYQAETGETVWVDCDETEVPLNAYLGFNSWFNESA